MKGEVIFLQNEDYNQNIILIRRLKGLLLLMVLKKRTRFYPAITKLKLISLHGPLVIGQLSCLPRNENQTAMQISLRTVHFNEQAQT